jgi:Putative transposase
LYQAEQHRVAISNRRLVALQNGLVTFRWKDYVKQNQPAMMTLHATEFIRRFFLHVLPKGLVRIRHFGFLANRCRRQKISFCRRLLGVAVSIKSYSLDLGADSTASGQKAQLIVRCPVCKVGSLRPVEHLRPQAEPVARNVTRFVLALSEANTS